MVFSSSWLYRLCFSLVGLVLLWESASWQVHSERTSENILTSTTLPKASSTPSVPTPFEFQSSPLAFQCEAHHTCVTLLLLNDVYQAYPSSPAMAGTLARASVAIEAFRRQVPHVAFVFAGDLLSPSLPSYYTHGSHMIEAMNQLHPLVATLGNHEFDFGTEVMETQIAHASFPWLAANLVVPSGVSTHIKPWLLTTLGGKKVLFYGLLTEETNTGSKINQGYLVTPAVAYAQKNLPPLVKKLKPEVVIALTHLSLAEDKRLAREVPDIDIILGGHDHDQVLEVIPSGKQSKTIPILKMDSDAKTLGRLQLQIPSSSYQKHRSIGWQYQAYSLQHTPIDEAFMATLQKQLSPHIQHLQTPVGKSLVALDARRQTIRHEETALGNLIATII
ncbi:MAG: bifunctional metallophosphatase/5'-nucleotidase [Vampirovibrionales bacterium]